MPSTDWKEVVAPDEGERFLRHAELLRDLQQRLAKKRPMARALHAKGHAGLEGTFTFHADVPPHAKFGLGEQPKSYRALVRFSNGVPRRDSDTKPDVRGMAVKLLGVQGKKIIPGMEDAKTQDFLAITGQVPFRNADEFVWFVRAVSEPASLPFKALLKFGPRALSMLARSIKDASQKRPSLATTRFASNVPIQWGPYAAKYVFVPLAADAAGAREGKSPERFGEELTARLAAQPVEYDFKLQFFEDAQRTPIEDSSVEWKVSDAPLVTVGRLTIHPQPVGPQNARVEGLSFDPWHALEAHRPLGDMMRARNVAYRLSTQERKASPEPD